MIENVLKIVKPPTNSAMRAKITNAVEKIDEGLVDDARVLVDDRLTGHDLDAGWERCERWRAGGRSCSLRARPRR